MSVVPDQIPVWDKKHAIGKHEKLRETPSPLARLAESKFIRNAAILELGCGVGRDAIYFEAQGHRVIATDGSSVVIAQNKSRFPGLSVTFEVLDMRDLFPYEPAAFDGVFANLSLHYYSNHETKDILTEIHKVLKPKGVLAFACKSVSDVHHGQGQEIQPDIFLNEKGEARHLFSEAYTRKLLDGTFTMISLETVEEEFSGGRSSIIRVIARKQNEDAKLHVEQTRA